MADSTPDPGMPFGSSQDERRFARRQFIARAVSGATFVTLGGLYVFSDALTQSARAETRADGRPRVPPGQRVIERLKPMGGEPGDPELSRYRLRVYGEVEHPFELTFAELLALPQTDQRADVHCVTGWTVLDAHWQGVRLKALAEKAGIKPTARHVIFEAAHGYTANIPRREALQDNVLVAHHYDDAPLARANGAPVRALVPDLYFWKSAKWLTGIRFSQFDESGYWETRGYNNHGDPWREERYS
ncbi:MAG TPA: molybdopterin-dependent oxidoreductase [Polyangiaceae bacterium]|jgi:DMSO/TMAO reductase YedYZ molybdopterin-dependent catalytic subunit|nr:molybdopterin-dependent oxidoreductase [Polyangiaceae bacterium]